MPDVNRVPYDARTGDAEEHSWLRWVVSALLIFIAFSLPCLPSEPSNRYAAHSVALSMPADHADKRDNVELDPGKPCSQRLMCSVIWPSIIRFVRKAAEDPAAAFTVVLAISTIGLWLQTQRLTGLAKKQLEKMEGSIKASQRASDAAAKSADTAEKQLVILERPWIFVELHPGIFSAQALQTAPGGQYATFDVANHGRMPAIIKAVSAGMVGEDNGRPNEPAIADHLRGVIGPGAKMKKLRASIPAGMKMKRADGMRWQPDLPSGGELFFSITIDYQDVGGNKFYSRFCWRYDNGIDAWVTFGGAEYNRTS